MAFSETARIITPMHEYYNTDKLLEDLKSLPKPKGGTRLDIALQLTQRDLFGKDVLADKNPKFLFIFTDGVHSSPYGIDLAVKPLHLLGIKVCHNQIKYVFSDHPCVYFGNDTMFFN